MKFILTNILIFFSAIVLHAQESDFSLAQYFEWENPHYESIKGEDTVSIHYLKNKMAYHFHFSDGNFVKDRLVYKKVYLNRPSGIEDFNKVYIPLGKNNELLEFAARSIKGDKVVDVDDDDIESGIDEESGNTYNYFAINGLEVGAIVEYYYILRESPNVNGIAIEYQYDIPLERFEWDLFSPSHLEFAAKVYNLNDSIISDTLKGGLRHLYLHVDNVPAYNEESTSSSDDHYGRLIFKIHKNHYSGKTNLVNYFDFAQRVVDAIHKDISRKGEKAVQKLLDRIKDNSYPELTMAENIDVYLKKNFSYRSSGSEELNEIRGIIKTKAYSGFGGLRLYSRLLGNAEIDYQIVYTTNRHNLKFDPEFEAYNFLDEVLIYIPGKDLFLDYSDPSARNGVVNYMFTGNKGLFIDQMKLGENTVAVAEVKDIPYKPASYSLDSLWVDVKFGPDLQQNMLYVRHALTGYSARRYQALHDVIPNEDDFVDYANLAVKYVDMEAKLDTFIYKNAGGQHLGKKPFVARGELSNADIIESAGSNYLFKVGKLIGRQTELYYEDTVRQFDIENDFAKVYYRTITFQSPEGYEVSGLDKLNTIESLEWDGKEVARFESNVTQEGNKYTVTLYEYYEGLTYPKEKFTEYAAVINAAADFNKIALLLEKI